MEFKDRLYMAMQQNNIRQKDLASKTGIPKSALSHYMSGICIPKAQRIFVLSKALNVSAEWLIYGKKIIGNK